METKVTMCTGLWWHVYCDLQVSTHLVFINCIISSKSYADSIPVSDRQMKLICLIRTHPFLTKRQYFSVCVYCNRSQITSQRVKNKKVRHETKSSGVTVVLYTLWCLLWSIKYTHTEKCNLFVLYNKNWNGLLYWRIFGAWKKKNKSADVDLTPSVCVSFNRSRSTTNGNAHRSHVIVQITITHNSQPTTFKDAGAL